MPRISHIAKQHVEKARSAALCAVDNYNRPNSGFRTRTFTVLIVIAWTALLHAIFYQRRVKPWYSAEAGKRRRYVRVDGDPKHWELAECLRQYWGHQSLPERSNLEFMLHLRNKIEHRDHPELDPALYGECQAALMNFEDLLITEFGSAYALSPELSVALQFSALRPEAQSHALRRLQASTATDLLEFMRAYRAGLPADVLDSSKYSLKVFLVPKLANRQSAADLAVEFVPYDPTKPNEMMELQKVSAMIKDRRVPVSGEGLMKPKLVVRRVRDELPFDFSMDTHTRAWKHYGVRPSGGSKQPEKTKDQYCIYDALAETYGYTDAWVRLLIEELSDPQKYVTVTGRVPAKRARRQRTGSATSGPDGA